MQPYSFTESYQTLIVAAVLKDPKFLTESRDAIKPEYFTKYLEQEIVRLSVEYFDKYKQKPSRDILLQLIYDKAKYVGWQDSDRDNLVMEMYKVYQYPLNEADCLSVKDSICKFARLQAIKIAILSSLNVIELYEKGDDSSDLDGIQRNIQSALNVGANKSRGVDVRTAMVDMRGLLKTSKQSSTDSRVLTGYPTMDQLLRGGLGAGELGLIIAPSNKGKSMLLVNLACAGFRQNKNVIYFTLEMSEPEVTTRIAANLTGFDMDTVQSNDPAYLDEVQRVFTNFPGGVYKVVHVKPSEATANNFRAIISDFEVSEGWRPHEIIVDYLDEMAAPIGYKAKSDETYNKYGMLTSELLSISHDYGCPMWTASQVNRDGYNGEPSLNDTGRSMQKIDKAEFVFCPIQSESQARENRMLLKILKNRRGPGVNHRITCSTDLKKARIYEVQR